MPYLFAQPEEAAAPPLGKIGRQDAQPELDVDGGQHYLSAGKRRMTRRSKRTRKTKKRKQKKSKKSRRVRRSKK